MKTNHFILLCVVVIVLSSTVTYYSCTDDKTGLFISCLGAFATCATLFLAFRIFRNYSATVDIQKRQFELVEDVLSFFITKSFTAKTISTYYYSYLNNERLDYLLEGLKSSREHDKPVMISVQFFDFLLEVYAKVNHHLFPTEIKMELLSNIPSVLMHNTPADAIIFSMGKENDEFGVPGIGMSQILNTEQFILSMNTVRAILVGYLNKKLHSTYKIKV